LGEENAKASTGTSIEDKEIVQDSGRKRDSFRWYSRIVDFEIEALT
jgi:hypothetical protein